jgi:GntR family transcriptional repressor for pyruvate dehydrogenase complex
MLCTMVYVRRGITVERARDLKDSAEIHRHNYPAIRDRDGDRARVAMSEHHDLARMAQASEELVEAPSPPPLSPPEGR